MPFGEEEDDGRCEMLGKTPKKKKQLRHTSKKHCHCPQLLNNNQPLGENSWWWYRLLWLYVEQTRCYGITARLNLWILDRWPTWLRFCTQLYLSHPSLFPRTSLSWCRDTFQSR
jgi:hypothetical protein